jgi:hypothetical protein
MAALAWPSMIWTAFTCAPAAIARLAAVCRSSCGTRPGTLLAVAAQSKLRSRNPWTRSTSPHCEVNRRSSGDLPAMRTATARGSGTACACGADGGSSTPAAGFDGSRRPYGLTEHGRENVVGLPGCGGGHLSRHRADLPGAFQAQRARPGTQGQRRDGRCLHLHDLRLARRRARALPADVLAGMLGRQSSRPKPHCRTPRRVCWPRRLSCHACKKICPPTHWNGSIQQCPRLTGGTAAMARTVCAGASVESAGTAFSTTVPW